MDDGFDLYADFEAAPSPVPAHTSSPIAVKSAPIKANLLDALKASPIASPTPPSRTSFAECNVDNPMRTLLEVLCAAGEADDSSDTDVPTTNECGGTADATCGLGLLMVDGVFSAGDSPFDSAPAPKRPRTKAVPSPSPLNDRSSADFDFEADLPEGPCSGEISLLATVDDGGGDATGAPFVRTGFTGKRLEEPTAAAPLYIFNPQTQRWEQGDVPTAASAPNRSRGSRSSRNGYDGGKGAGGWKGGNCAAGKAKTALCRHFVAGACSRGDDCKFAHGDSELRSDPGRDRKKQAFVFQSIAEAKQDASENVCEYPQALAVRLALKFEERPDDILASMEQAGLPGGADRRATVKALLRLCHPDKCRHPEAKMAVQILSPLLVKG